MLTKHAGLHVKWMELDKTTTHWTEQAVTTGTTVLAETQMYQKENIVKQNMELWSQYATWPATHSVY